MEGNDYVLWLLGFKDSRAERVGEISVLFSLSVSRPTATDRPSEEEEPWSRRTSRMCGEQ